MTKMRGKQLTDFLKGVGISVIIGASVLYSKSCSTNEGIRYAGQPEIRVPVFSKHEEKKQEVEYSGIRSYKIGKGKTLGHIAKELGIPAVELAEFNIERGYLENPGAIRAENYLIYPSDKKNEEYGLQIIETPAVNFRKVKGKRKIDEVIIHINDGGNMSGLRELTRKNERGVSAHYDVLTNGDVHRLVKENDSAQHAGRKHNLDTIGIEFAGRGGDDFTEEQIENGAKLIAGILRKYDLGTDAVKPHSHYDPKRRCNCPGKENFERIKERVRQLGE